MIPYIKLAAPGDLHVSSCLSASLLLIVSPAYFAIKVPFLIGCVVLTPHPIPGVRNTSKPLICSPLPILFLHVGGHEQRSLHSYMTGINSSSLPVYISPPTRPLFANFLPSESIQQLHFELLQSSLQLQVCWEYIELSTYAGLGIRN